MFVPPLDVIQKALAEQLGSNNHQIIKVKALQVRAVPGYQSLKEILALSYNITEFTERQMKLQLNFTNATQVSLNTEPDSLEIKFVGNYFYFDTHGLTI
jgi:hypothetical protein